MPQQRSPAEIQAEARSEETRQFGRQVRRVTRRKFTPRRRCALCWRACGVRCR